MVDEREAFLANGWKQFCILKPDIHPALHEHAHFTVQDDCLLLVITQTCDLVNDVDKEPFFEVICMRPLDRAPSNNCTYGKNCRRIELSLTLGEEEKHFYLLAHERCFVEHHILTEIKPLLVIDDNNVKRGLIRWLANRYIRKAFPDTYNNRMDANKRKIEKSIKRFELVEDIYIRLNSENELDDGREYEIDILLLMDSSHFDNPDIYGEYEELKNNLETEINTCAGINVESICLDSNANLTVKELQEYDRWDYSYLSYRNSDHHVSPKQ